MAEARLKVVAVPAAVPTWEKFVQPEPVQRSIRTSVWPVEPFVHLMTSSGADACT